MFDDLAAHFHENVITPYEEYLAEKRERKSGRSRDLRLGLVAASAMYHFREHLQPPHATDVNAIVGQCPDYAILKGVVNAFKHGQLTRGTPSLHCAQDIEEVVVILELADERGVYRHAEKTVEIALRDGTRRRLHDVLRNVINFWIRHLTTAGLISARPEYEEVAYIAPTREESWCSEDGAARLDLEVVRGLRLKQTMQFRRLQLTVNVSLTHSETGETVQRPVQLSIEESTRLTRCRNDEERSALLQSFESVQRAAEEMVEEHES